MTVAFQKWLASRGVKYRLARSYACAVRRVLRLADPERFARRSGVQPRTPLAKVERQRDELQAEPGTIAAFYFDTYLPEALGMTGAQHRDRHVNILKKMRACFGRHLRFDELNAANLALFINWLAARALKLETIKQVRTLLLTLWRFAVDRGLASEPPRVRRLKVPREQPDAWSLDEVNRIIAAARLFRSKPLCGIAANKWWTGIMLTCWYTALRRGSLFAIRTADVNLEERWLYVPAGTMKNRVGKRYRIGHDAAAAIREIYDPRRELLFPINATLRTGGHACGVSDQFRDILIAAGVNPASRLPGKFFHKLRRTVATHTAARAGMAAASALLNHSGPDLIKRYIDPSVHAGQ
jgi:integrase